MTPTRKAPAAPGNTRNGLKWRDGRPRWEPSPANRKAGLGGRDLKTGAGDWLERGAAIDICDARTLWAQLIREALQGGPAGDEACADLTTALDQLQPPADDAGRLKRALLQDLLDRAADVAGAGSVPIVGPGPRTVAALVEAYFAAGPREVTIKASSRETYTTQSKKLLARFGTYRVGEITRSMMQTWYLDLCDAYSLSTANQTIGAAAAFFAFGVRRDWLMVSPATKLSLTAAEGRLVFISVAEEQAFTAFCDANGYEDVADGWVAGLWTGARISDLCAADLEDLAGDVWSFIPIKTERHGQRAMPGLVSPVKARVARRRRASTDDKVRHLNTTPFLFDFRTGRRHDTKSFYRRFVDAKDLYLASDGALTSFADKRMQDTRDTCVTRLFEALKTEIAKIWVWTGHSDEDVKKILRKHYLVLREEGSRGMADELEAWARKEGMAL